MQRVFEQPNVLMESAYLRTERLERPELRPRGRHICRCHGSRERNDEEERDVRFIENPRTFYDPPWTFY
jgi:hypothetical protein